MAGAFDEFMALVNSFSDRTLLEQRATDALASQSAQIAVVGGVRQHFIAGVTPDGEPWPKLQRARPGSQGNDQPLRDSDRLMAATTSKSEGTSITVENNRRQAALQNFGGVIVPVKGRWLTLPRTLEAKRAGGAANFPGMLKFVHKLADGTRGPFLVDEEGEVQYELRKKVTIPARTFIGFSEETIDTIFDIVIDRVLNPAKQQPGGQFP